MRFMSMKIPLHQRLDMRYDSHATVINFEHRASWRPLFQKMFWLSIFCIASQTPIVIPSAEMGRCPAGLYVCL